MGVPSGLGRHLTMARKEYRKSKESSNPVSYGQIRPRARGTARGCVSITICAEGAQRSSNRRCVPEDPVSAPATGQYSHRARYRDRRDRRHQLHDQLGPKRVDVGHAGRPICARQHRRDRARSTSIVRCTDDLVLHNDLVEALGTGNLTYWSHAGLGGTAPSAMISQAVGAILSGQATTVLCFRALNGRTGRRFGAGAGHGQAVVGGEEQRRYDERPDPALRTDRSRSDVRTHRPAPYGRVRTTHERLGAIALVCRERRSAARTHSFADKKADDGGLPRLDRSPRRSVCSTTASRPTGRRPCGS